MGKVQVLTAPRSGKENGGLWLEMISLKTPRLQNQQSMIQERERKKMEFRLHELGLMNSGVNESEGVR